MSDKLGPILEIGHGIPWQGLSGVYNTARCLKHGSPVGRKRRTDKKRRASSTRNCLGKGQKLKAPNPWQPVWNSVKLNFQTVKWSCPMQIGNNWKQVGSKGTRPDKDVEMMRRCWPQLQGRETSAILSPVLNRGTKAE